jgi:hypothetical protein
MEGDEDEPTTTTWPSPAQAGKSGDGGAALPSVGMQSRGGCALLPCAGGRAGPPGAGGHGGGATLLGAGGQSGDGGAVLPGAGVQSCGGAPVP